MLKKIKLILTELLIILSFATGCSNNADKSEISDLDANSLSKYNPEIELTVAGDYLAQGNEYDYLHNPWIDAYHSELGIDIKSKWEVDYSTDPVEKLNEQLAIGVIPDIMTGLNRAQFEMVVRLGLAADLTDLLKEYATPLTNEILYSDGGYALQSSTMDGKLYSLPYVYDNTDNIAMMWIRTDWLENLGLEYPKTTDELYQVLDAFVNKDPDQNGVNDTVGLLTTNTLWETGSIFNMFGAQPFWSWYLDNQKTLKYSTVSFTDNIKNSLSYMQNLYKNGLMYKEFGVMDYEQFFRMFQEGKAGIAFENKYFPVIVQEGVIQKDPNADWQAFPIPTGLENMEPARPFSYHGPAAYNIISSKCENPEAAIKMLNLFTEIKYSGRKDQDFPQFKEFETNNDIEDFALYSTGKANDLSGFEHISDALEKKDPSKLTYSEKIKYNTCLKYLIGDRKFWADYKIYGPGNVSTTILQYYSKEVTPFFSDYYGPDTPSLRQNIAMLDTKWNTTCTRIIMSGEDVNNYDKYVTDWYSLGGFKIEHEINDNYLKILNGKIK